jgi:glycosyltransferase involved in cell wall biosynthesis
MKNNIKVSIITPSFNSVRTIEKTILSVLEQDYDNLEFIIIDGGSTDGTVDIIKKHQDKIHYWISGPDKGISDAFNKGLSVATGDYINFQGADDYLLQNNVISLMMANIDPEKDLLVCGRIERIKDTQEREIVFKTSANFSGKRSLLFRMSLPHQALFTNKKFFEKYSTFDVNNKFCMDYEMILRAYKNFPEVVMKDVFVSAWREGGVGKDKTLEIFKEYLAIKKKNKIAPIWILYIIHLWSIIKYYIKKLIGI